MRVDNSKILNPGLLRDQVIWQQKSVSHQNSMGEDVFDWVNVHQARALIVSFIGLETEESSQRQAKRNYRITQHAKGGLNSAMRISWTMRDGQVRILNVLNIQEPPGIGLYQVVTAEDFE